MAEDIDWRQRGRSTSVTVRLPRLPSNKKPVASTLSVGGRLRIARGVPQAVLKILSYRRGADAVRRTLAYVAGKAGDRFIVEGDLEVEGREARVGLVTDWSRDFSTRANGRDVMHMEVSAPPGSDRAQLLAAARAFAAETFGATHQYALAEHRDTAHPHCHLLVKLRGHDGRQLDPRKALLSRWRESFAKAARAQGLMLDASPRIARGSPPRSRSRARLAVEKRGALKARSSGAVPGQQHQERRTDSAKLAYRLTLERDEFYRTAQRLVRTGDTKHDAAEAHHLRSAARELLAFGDKLGAAAEPPTKGLEAPRQRRQQGADIGPAD